MKIAMEMMCKLFPDHFGSNCSDLVNTYFFEAWSILKLDIVCQYIHTCRFGVVVTVFILLNLQQPGVTAIDTNDLIIRHLTLLHTFTYTNIIKCTFMYKCHCHIFSLTHAHENVYAYIHHHVHHQHGRILVTCAAFWKLVSPPQHFKSKKLVAKLIVVGLDNSIFYFRSIIVRKTLYINAEVHKVIDLCFS